MFSVGRQHFKYWPWLGDLAAVLFSMPCYSSKLAMWWFPPAKRHCLCTLLARKIPTPWMRTWDVNMNSEILLGLLVDRSYDMRLRHEWSSIWSDFLNSNAYSHICHHETYRSGVRHFVLYNLLYVRLEYLKSPFARCKTPSLSRNFERLLVTSRITEKDRVILTHLTNQWQMI